MHAHGHLFQMETRTKCKFSFTFVQYSFFSVVVVFIVLQSFGFMPLDFYANKSWIEYDNIRIFAPAIESHIVAECDMDQIKCIVCTIYSYPPESDAISHRYQWFFSLSYWSSVWRLRWYLNSILTSCKCVSSSKWHKNLGSIQKP